MNINSNLQRVKKLQFIAKIILYPLLFLFFFFMILGLIFGSRRLLLSSFVFIILILPPGIIFGDRLNVSYKADLIHPLLISLFDKLTFLPDKGIEQEFVENIDFFDMNISFSSKNYFSGEYKSVPFIFSDISTLQKQFKRDENGNIVASREIPAFHGQLLVFNFIKPFLGTAKITTPSFKYSKLPFSEDDAPFFHFQTGDRILDNSFSILVQDKDSMSQILTPDFLQSLLVIKSKIKHDMMICLADGKMYVFIDSNADSFTCITSTNLSKFANDDYLPEEPRIIIEIIDKLILSQN